MLQKNGGLAPIGLPCNPTLLLPIAEPTENILVLALHLLAHNIIVEPVEQVRIRRGREGARKERERTIRALKRELVAGNAGGAGNAGEGDTGHDSPPWTWAEPLVPLDNTNNTPHVPDSQ